MTGANRDNPRTVGRDGQAQHRRGAGDQQHAERVGDTGGRRIAGLIREIAYALPDDRREMKAARYCNWRINRQVNAEDTVLIERVQAGMSSSSYVSGPLSPAEPCLAAFADRLRAAIPEAALTHPPA